MRIGQSEIEKQWLFRCQKEDATIQAYLKAYFPKQIASPVICYWQDQKQQLIYDWLCGRSPNPSKNQFVKVYQGDLNKITPLVWILDALDSQFDLRTKLKDELLAQPYIGPRRAEYLLGLRPYSMMRWVQIVRALREDPDLFVKRVVVRDRQTLLRGKQPLFSHKSVRSLRVWLCSWDPSHNERKSAAETPPQSELNS